MEPEDLASVIETAEKVAAERLHKKEMFNKYGIIPYEFVQRETTNILLSMMVWKNDEYNRRA